MKRFLSTLLLAAMAPAALAQDAPPEDVYQSEKPWKFEADGFFRQEWTDDITFIEKSRQLGRLRPRIEFGLWNKVFLGAGGDFLYGSQENTVPPPTVATLPLLRDNFDSRDARLDLAYLRVELGPLKLGGGRFIMPLRFTEMVWDRELRPQGGFVGLEVKDFGPFKRLGVTGIGARGSHVFPQEGAFDFEDRETVWMGSAFAAVGLAEGTSLEVAGTYITWSDLEFVDPRLRRQNSRVAPGGALAVDYDVVDVTARYVREGNFQLQLIADYCWNTALERDNTGLWLAAVLGSTDTAHGSLEYTYAKVDADATLAAFAGDDFLWETGWEGHRGDLGFRLQDSWSVHGIAQWQRFKDAPQVIDRDKWLERYRVELRLKY